MKYLLLILVLLNSSYASCAADPREERRVSRQRVKDSTEARKKRDELIAGLRIRIPDLPKTEEERMGKRKFPRRRHLKRPEPRPDKNKEKPAKHVYRPPTCHSADVCFYSSVIIIAGLIFFNKMPSLFPFHY